VSVEAPAEVPAENLAEVPVEDAPTEPVIGGATDSSAAAGADDPTEVFNPITQNAAIGEKADDEKPKN
jgi:NADH dehydrogenase, FAD-binding subunit